MSAAATCKPTSGLADITLKWMLDEARHAGNLRRKQGEVAPDSPHVDPELLHFNPDRYQLVLGVPSPSGPYEKLLYRKPKWSQLHVSLKCLWWVLEVLPHVHYDKDLGAYHEHMPHKESDESAEVRRIPFGAYRQIPDGALIHGTVIARRQTASADPCPPGTYNPPNLLKGTLELSGEFDLEGIPYYVFREPEAAKKEKRKKPSAVKLFLQSKWIMLPLATVELILLLGFILIVVSVPSFWLLHLLLASLWWLFRHVRFLVVFAHWIMKYPAAWKWYHR